MHGSGKVTMHGSGKGNGSSRRTGGGAGGKGAKPQFTRVIPKFLKQYESMLSGPKPAGVGGEE